MRLGAWSTLFVFGAVASSTPLSTSHEVHLPYLPSPSSQHNPEAYLSLKWSMVNGSLYANNDQVFPPTVSMQLHAHQFTGQPSARIGEEDLELFYSLHARPLSLQEAGVSSKIVRVRVDLMNLQGEPVTPNAVVLDLFTYPDGSQQITRIRMEPGKGHRQGQDRPWHMKFWQTQTTKEEEHRQDASPVHPPSGDKLETATSKTNPDTQPAQTEDSKEEVTQVGFIFSPYWSPSAYSHRGHGHRHPHHQNRPFMRLIRPVILPAILGATAGLVACLVGFVIGHLFMALSSRLGLRKNKQDRRSSLGDVEIGTPGEKSALMMIPEINVTDSDEEV